MARETLQSRSSLRLSRSKCDRIVALLCTRLFLRQTIIDCNVWVRVTKGKLLQKLQSGEASEKARIPEDILVKLRAGVLASPLVEEEIKEKLRS